MALLRNLTLGQYLPGSSPVHRLDPRAKLVASLVAMAATFLPGPQWAFLCSWPLLIVGVGVSRVPLGYYARGFRPFLWLFGFTLALHGLTTPGRSLWPFPAGSVDFTAEGLLQGVSVSGQLATAVAFSSLLTLTTNPVDLVWALERLLSPLARLRVPVGEFCVTMLLAIRFFPILHQEAERLTLALKARGIDPGEGNLRQRIQNLTPLIVPLFRQVLHRAETLGLAMQLRAYRVGAPRTSWRSRSFGACEALALVFSGVTLLAAALLPRLPLGS